MAQYWPNLENRKKKIFREAIYYQLFRMSRISVDTEKEVILHRISDRKYSVN